MSGARSQPLPTVAELLLARADDPGAGLRAGDRTWSWAEHVAASAVRASVLRELLPDDAGAGVGVDVGARAAPRHVGVLADNVPEYSLLLGAAALSGAVVVGLNPTRRGPALARDVALADCGVVLTQGRHAALLDGLDVGVPVIDLDGPRWSALLEAHAGAPPPIADVATDSLLALVFTSGTSGEPKAVQATHGKFAGAGTMLAQRFGLNGADTAYIAMPLFHSNALLAGWSVAVAAGATIALAERFSASKFLTDVRRYGATYANYVGTPLSYILATEERADDADNPLRVLYGNEGRADDIAAFARRFGCHVQDGYGSSENGVAIARTPDTPPDALGPLPDGVAVWRPGTTIECPRAETAPDGTLLNADEAVGELVNTAGTGGFSGYYNDPGADAARAEGGVYRTGDLAYVDRAGFVHFAGRTGDWMRVGGENLGVAPIERALLRHPAVAEAAVYGLPDRVGDQVAAALVPAPGAELDPADIAAFLRAQPDLGPRQYPRRWRVVDELPRTPSFKVLRRALVADGIDATAPLPGE
ncbi:AMP-binding protein [Tsukamurella asaccharolytica]|uniref:AMP-binding protein n=1 Tax=Tsukamurella asaccharolytica TaxID=2592067 RepID=A0A5C5RFD5_9ACTN|nr:AMP-binding protein [Tsukamurella asaccharolytica]TWS21264.1 AMP-binding protein [Tsukamurella asaccharolytica]